MFCHIIMCNGNVMVTLGLLLPSLSHFPWPDWLAVLYPLVLISLYLCVCDFMLSWCCHELRDAMVIKLSCWCISWSWYTPLLEAWDQSSKLLLLICLPQITCEVHIICFTIVMALVSNSYQFTASVVLICGDVSIDFLSTVRLTILAAVGYYH